MLRPHAAGFIYSPTDSQIILRDCQLLLETGIAGIAFGSLTDCHELELELLTQVRRASAGRVLVMHRAFDQTRDVACGLEQLISCGVDRVLTSAGFPSAVLGAARLRELQCQADGRIEILPGGGVLLENAIALLRQTGCKQVHGSFKRIDERGALRPDLAQIAALRALLDQLD
jgi:copper homeostasis protein